jgi:2-polyprenyl-6-methoxyphenol hydroxylase-like FAD-dependent oxidoreductase
MIKTVTPFLIVGAGPAGLMLSAQLVSRGIGFQIIDVRSSHGQASRATGLHPETLSLFERIGCLDSLLAEAHILKGNRVYVDSKPILEIIFANGERPKDKNYSVLQSTTERVLLEYLRQNGVIPHYNKRFESHQTVGSITRANCRCGERPVEFRARVIVGADGAHSDVRKSCGVAFEGTTDQRLSFVVDAHLESGVIDFQYMHQFFTVDDRLVCVPLPGERRVKISGFMPPEQKELGLSSVDKVKALTNLIGRVIGCSVDLDVTSLLTYHLGSRIANSFYHNHCVLIGDAAHTFFPLGGYGLNAALADAADLATICEYTNKSPKLFKLHLEMWSARRRSIALAIQDEVKSRRSKLSYATLREKLDRGDTRSIFESDFRRRGQ